MPIARSASNFPRQIAISVAFVRALGVVQQIV